MVDLALEEKKYNVTKGIYSIGIVCFILLSITNYFDNTIFFIQAVSSLALSSICLFIIYFFKTYKIPVYITIIFSFVLHFIGFLTDSFVGNQADFLWITNLAILAFYTVGKSWGLFYLLTNIGILMLIKILSVNGIVSHVSESTPVNTMSILAYIINITGCTILFLYLISQILRGYNDIREDLMSVNNELKIQYSEKSTMLKEIHHRVKNNLQVITSLLRLQLYKIEDEKIKGPFQESINRVSTMALIHAKMYQGDSVNQLDLTAYLKDLSKDLVKLYPTKNGVKTSIKSELNELDNNDLVPFSLIINELITNSIKHGFKKIDFGEISIEIQKNDLEIQLIYKDNGIWQEPKNESSFGLELIETLTEHFEGSFETIKDDSGTEFRFTLHLNVDE